MIYLDNSATSRYKPFSCIWTLARETSASSNPGRSGHRDAVNAALKILDCREKLSALTGGGEIIFTKNCTEALNLAIFGGNYGEQVIITVFEHNSVLRPLYRLREQGKIRLTVLEPDVGGRISAEKLERALRTPTSLVAVNEMSNVIGVRQDVDVLAAVAKRYGARVLVDTAQSFLHTDATYKDVDFVAGSGHKTLHGPQGTGFLRVAKGIKLAPLLYGGTGTASGSTEQPTDYPEGFESGTLNAAGIIALAKSIRWTVRHKKTIKAKLSQLSKQLVAGLNEINGVTVYYPNDGGVTLFNIDGFSSMETADRLSSSGIAVRAGYHCAPLAHEFLGTAGRGGVRVSVGYNNSLSDVDTLVGAVRRIVSDRPQ